MFSPSSDIRIKYWKNIWEELCSNIKQGIDYVQLINPHLLAIDIESTSKFTKAICLFYIHRIEFLLEQKSIPRASHISQLKNIKESLETSNFSKSRKLCLHLKNKFANGKYAYELWRALIEVFQTPFSEKHYSIIKDLSLELISEFILLGHHIMSIQSYVSNTFSLYEHEGALYSHLENHSIDEREYGDYWKFRAAVAEYDSHLSNWERICSFADYISKRREKYSFFLQVVGLRIVGQHGQYRFQNCTLYNPDQISLLGDSLTNDARIELRSCVDKGGFSIIKIDLEAIDPDIGYEKALEKAIHLVNILKLIYNQPCYGTQIWTTNYFYVNEAGSRIRFDGIPFPGNMVCQPEMLDCEILDDAIRTIKLSELIKNGRNGELNAIEKAVYFYTKSRAAQTDEEILLNCWISMECFFEGTKDKFAIIQSIIACGEILFAKSNVLINLYQKVFRYYRTDLQFLPEEGVIMLPEELANEIGMRPDQKPNLAVFRRKLGEIAKYVYRENILQEIERVDQIYSDAETAYSALRAMHANARQEITYMYKCRNQIVHSGHNNRIMLPYAGKAAQHHARQVLMLFLTTFSFFSLDVTGAVRKINEEVSMLFDDLAKGNLNALKTELFSGTGLLYNTRFQGPSDMSSER